MTDRPCPIDLDQAFTLTIGVYGNHLESELGGRSESGTGGLPCSSYSMQFIDSTKSFSIRWSELVGKKIIFKDTIVAPEQLKIEALCFICFRKADKPAIKTPFFKQIDFPYLKSIHIELECDNLELKTWHTYKTLIKKNNLESFTYNYCIYDSQLIDDLTPFSNLKTLEISATPSYELLSFVNLENLNFYTNYLDIAFPHQLTQLDQLNSENVFDADIFAIKTFFWENLKVKSNNEGSFPYMSLSSINKIISENLQDEFANNEDMIVLAKDLRPYFHESWKIDTVANGQLKNGAMIGVWRYKVLTGNRYSEFYFNHSQIQQKIPKNGNWKYLYYNDSTAITGKFKNGKKDGIWSFYRPNGDLQATKTFKNDKLIGLSKTYFSAASSKFYEHNGSYAPVDYEVRRFFFSNNSLDYAEVKIYSDSVFKWKSPHMLFDTLAEEYIVYPDGNMHIRNADAQDKIIIKNTTEYNELLYEHYLMYLFPECNHSDFYYNPIYRK